MSGLGIFNPKLLLVLLLGFGKTGLMLGVSLGASVAGILNELLLLSIWAVTDSEKEINKTNYIGLMNLLFI